MSNKAQGGLATVKYALNDVLQTDTDLRGISVTVFLCREPYKTSYEIPYVSGCPICVGFE